MLILWARFILSEGLVVGIGQGCLFAPMVGTVTAHFSTKKGVAISIASTGSVLGELFSQH